MHRESWRFAPQSVRIGEPAARRDTLLKVYARAQLGIGPDAEIVRAAISGYRRSPRLALRRAQDGTEAADWPAGTPLTWLRDVGSREIVVVNLGADLAAAATELDLLLVYRRFKIDDELCHAVKWATGSVGQPMTVRRGQEGTTAAPHDTGAEVVWLAAGES